MYFIHQTDLEKPYDVLGRLKFMDHNIIDVGITPLFST